jgi:sterol desaturase/sphingolipid hydroxylase (fatty acid hydroxylase superfamily)
MVCSSSSTTAIAPTIEKGIIVKKQSNDKYGSLFVATFNAASNLVRIILLTGGAIMMFAMVIFWMPPPSSVVSHPHSHHLSSLSSSSPDTLFNIHNNGNKSLWFAWWLEPFVATAAFGGWINLYWYHERKHGLSSATSFGETCHLQSGGPLFYSVLAYWIGIYMFQCILVKNTTSWWPTSSASKEMNMIPIGMPSMTWMTTSPLEEDYNGLLLLFLQDCTYLVAEVLSGLLQYDFVMFFLHWMMHDIPALRSWHYQHHAHEEQRALDNYNIRNDRDTSNRINLGGKGNGNDKRSFPCEARDTLNHDLMDGSLQVAVNIVVQQYTLVAFLSWGWNCCGERLLLSSPSPVVAGLCCMLPKSKLARILHNIIVTWLLVESHTSSPTPYVWRRWCIGVKEHYWHHVGTAPSSSSVSSNGSRSISEPKRKIRRHQQFFGYLDEWRDQGWSWEFMYPTNNDYHRRDKKD